MPTTKNNGFTTSDGTASGFPFNEKSYQDAEGVYASFSAPGYSTVTEGDYNTAVAAYNTLINNQIAKPLPFSPLWDTIRVPVNETPPVQTVHTTLSAGANIQNAIDACPNNQTIRLNPGTYTVDPDLDFVSRTGIVLEGLGSSADDVIIKLNEPTAVSVDVNNSGSIYFYRITFDGQNGNSGNTHILVRNASPNFTMNQCKTVNTLGNAIRTTGAGADNGRIIDSTIQMNNSGISSRYGIEISGRTGWLIQNCIINEISSFGIRLASSAHNTIVKGCTLTKCASVAAAYIVVNDSDDVVLCFNDMYLPDADIGGPYDGPNTQGILINQASNNGKIYNNVVWNQQEEGIQFDGGVSSVTGTFHVFNNAFVCNNVENDNSAAIIVSDNTGALTINSYNNIFVSSKVGDLRIFFFSGNTSGVTLNQDYNCFYHTAVVDPQWVVNSPSSLATGTFTGLVAWQAAQTQDDNSVQINPAVVNLCGGNLLYSNTTSGPLLLAGTQLINGTHVNSIASEYDAGLTDLDIGPMTRGIGI